VRYRWMGALATLFLMTIPGCVPLKTPQKAFPAPASVAPGKPGGLSEERLPGLIVTEIEGKREPERLYSFSLRNADIREVLMAIAKQTSFNIVVDPKVKGSVTVDLKNVTLTEALDTLTDLLELSYAIKNNIIRVAEPAPETRVFSFQYVNVKRSGSSSTSAQIGAAGGGVTGATGTTGGTAGNVGGSSTVSTTAEADIWRDIEAGLGKILSPKGKVIVDKQGGNIFVTDFPKILDRIASFLESVEGSVQRQVLIEARIVEVTLTGDYRFGLDWGAIAQAAALRGASTLSANKILAQRLAPGAGGFQIGVVNSDFSALLETINTQGELNVLSSPKLATLNNQTAVIRAGTDEVFFETRISETPSLTGTQTSRTVTPRTVTVGVVLGVTPQIAPDGSVVLHIHPTVTEKRGETRSPAGDTFPVLDVREADMVVRAREGQVVVIGGLMQEKRSDSDSKVPILGDIPGIGRLFRGTTQEARKTELVVLLSPTVMIGKKVDEITAREIERVKKAKGRSPW